MNNPPRKEERSYTYSLWVRENKCPLLGLRSLPLLNSRCKNPCSPKASWFRHVKVHDNVCLVLYMGEAKGAQSLNARLDSTRYCLLLGFLFWGWPLSLTLGLHPPPKSQAEYFIIHPTMVDLSHVSRDALFQMVNSNSLTAPPSPLQILFESKGSHCKCHSLRRRKMSDQLWIQGTL
jgi:hypothetical protein